MLQDIFAELEKMSPAEKQALLSTEFPAEQVKEANAAIDSEQLADALYTYGALVAERQVAEIDGLDKVATEVVEAHDAALEETGNDIEAFMASTGIAELEDEVEFHKQAQACAGFMFQGYSDFIDKLAAAKGKGALKALHGAASALRKHVGSAAGKAGKAGHKALALAKKHPGRTAAGAGAVAAGVYGGKKLHEHMKKRASELSGVELAEAIVELTASNDEVLSEISEGVEKLAAAGKGKAMAFMKKHLEKLKGAAGAAHAAGKKHPFKAGALAGVAAGAAGTHAAHRASE